MLKLLLFLKRIHYVLLFLALEAIAISVFVRGNTYHKAKIVGTSNVLVSGIYDKASDVTGYFGLRTQNDNLLAENARLRTELARYQYADTLPAEATERVESLRYYEYQPARVVNNRVNHRENYITINKGTLDGVEPEMALITDEGIVGYILHCSDRFSVGVSILNTKSFRTSGCIKGSDYAGSIYWDGVDYREVVLDEMPKYAVMNPGDTVVTTHYSYIFPPDQPIGTVENFELVNGTFYRVRVKLFTDLGKLKNVYVVRYLEQEERRALEGAVGYYEVPGGEARAEEAAAVLAANAPGGEEVGR